MIETQALTKRFGRVTAVNGVDLEVRPGDRYGLLGPNGSGKTTVLRMLLGLVYATSGTIEVLGQPIPRRAARVLPQIGALVEGPAGYPHLPGRTNLRLIDAAGPSGPWRDGGPGRDFAFWRRGSRRDRRHRVEQALERVGLAGIDSRPLKAYSLGMRQRLGLAAALLRAPRLLVLDEPTNGLDPRGIREIRDLLAELNAAGTTVLLSSHLLGEVDALCTRVGVMDRGRLVVQDELDALRAPTGRVLVVSPDAGRAAALLDGRVEQRDGDRLTVVHPDPAQLNAMLTAEGLRVAELAPQRRSLEEVVLEATSASADRMDLPVAEQPFAGPAATDPAPTDQAGDRA
ncbi:MAG: ABC transporter ATP-binding protein [Micromonosporaceae bacterium]|nr:ABC transporter ATP-binding protein [Micromonosporaceae bacterium]